MQSVLVYLQIIISEVSVMTEILSYVFTAVAALILFFGVILGFLRGWKKSVVDIGIALICIVLSALIAAPVLSSLNDTISPIIKELISDSLGGTSYDSIAEVSPTADMLISKLPVALLAPIAFAVIFAVVAFVASFFAPLIASAIFGSDKKNKNKKEKTSNVHADVEAYKPDTAHELSQEQKHDNELKELEASESKKQEKAQKKPMSWMSAHLLGIPAGVVSAALVVFALLLPFAGYIGVVTDALDELRASDSQDVQKVLESDDFKNIDQYLAPLGDDAALNVIYTVGGKTLFNSLTSVTINGERYPVSRAVTTAVNLYVDSEPLMQVSVENYGDDQVNAIYNVLDDVDGEPLVTSLVAELVSGAARTWENGEAFFSIGKPQINGNFGAIVDRLISIYSTMTYDTVSSDLKVIADLCAALIKNDAMSVIKDNSKLMELLGKEGFVSSLIRPIQENERMQPIVKEISNLAIVLMAEKIGIPQNNTEIYNDLLDDVASSLNDAKASKDPEAAMAELKADVVKAFEDRAIDIPNEAMDYVTEYMLKAFEDKDNITSDDVVAYFTEISDGFEQYGVSAMSYGESAVTYSSGAGVSAAVSELIALLQALDIPESNFSVLKSLSTDVKNGEVNSGLVTVEKIVNSIGSVASADAEEESKLIETIMVSATSVIKSIEGKSGMDTVKSLDADALQSVIVSMQSSKTFGDVAEPLLEAVFTSETLKDTGFIDKSTFEDIKESGFDNISNTVQSVQKTVEIVESLTGSSDSGSSSGDSSSPEIEENIEWLVENMSPSTAKLLSKQLTDEKLKSFGLPEKNVDSVSQMLSNVLDAMASETELSKEEYKKEADAIKHLYDIATKVHDLKENDAIFNEVLADANDIASTILGSKVISKAMVNTVYDGNTVKDDPFKTEIKLSDENAAHLIDAINSYESTAYASADKETENRKIIALAACFNLSVEISANGTVSAK